MKPRMLWFKARMPSCVKDGSSFASLQMARRLGESFDIDLVTLRLTGEEDAAAKKLSPPFASVTVLDPENRGGVLRRGGYRLWYELMALIRKTPRAVFYESSPRVAEQLRRMNADLRYDLAYLEYWTAGDLLPAMDGVPTILHFHDATHAWLAQEADFTSGWRAWRLRSRAERVRRYEIQAAKSATKAHFLSPWDLAAFEAHGVTNGAYVPIPLPRLHRRPFAADEPIIAFLGRFEHRPNLDAAEYLADEVFPLVREHVPEARLVLAGPNMPPATQSRMSRAGVECPGWVDDLDALLERVAVAAAPSRFGAGTKTKVLDFMWRGVPVVASPIAARGTPAELGGAVVAHDAGEFANAIVRLLADPSERQRLRDTAWDLLEEVHCGEQAHRRIRDAFLSLAGASPIKPREAELEAAS